MYDQRLAVRDALDILKPPLASFVSESRAPGVSPTSPTAGQAGTLTDIAALLGSILQHWEAVFANQLKGRGAKGLVVELKNARNNLAHEQSFTWDQALLVTLNLERFLDMIPVTAVLKTAKERLEDLKVAVMKHRLSKAPGASALSSIPTHASEELAAHSRPSSVDALNSREFIGETSSPSESPPVDGPAEPDVPEDVSPNTDLASFFEDMGYDVVDNRSRHQRGALWIVGSSPQLEHIMNKMLRTHDVLFKFNEVGGVGCGGRPAWRLIKSSLRGSRFR